MKKLFLFVITILLLTLNGFCQELINEAKISFELPNTYWALTNKKEINDKEVYYYKREPINDSLGRQIIPNISFVVEPIDKKIDVITFSAIKRGQVSFDVIKVLTNEDGFFKLKNAIGYKGTYTDKFGEHTVYVIHTINNKKGVQIIFDVLSELFKEMDTEFLYSMKTLQVVK
jgi:hypothetical protein